MVQGQQFSNCIVILLKLEGDSVLSWFYRQNSCCPERLSDYTGSHGFLEIAESVNAVALACSLSVGSDLSIANKD